MGDMREAFDALKEHLREERAAHLQAGAAAVRKLEELGFTVKPLTEFHFRINGRLDLYPTRARYHDIKTGRRGGYDRANPARICERVLTGRRP